MYCDAHSGTWFRGRLRPNFILKKQFGGKQSGKQQAQEEGTTEKVQQTKWCVLSKSQIAVRKKRHATNSCKKRVPTFHCDDCSFQRISGERNELVETSSVTHTRQGQQVMHERGRCEGMNGFTPLTAIAWGQPSDIKTTNV